MVVIIRLNFDLNCDIDILVKIKGKRYMGIFRDVEQGFKQVKASSFKGCPWGEDSEIGRKGWKPGIFLYKSF